MKINKLFYWVTIGLISLAGPSHAAVVTYTEEAVFLGQLASVVSENFDGPAWDSVRSTATIVHAADSITSLGITWTSGDQVTTSTGAGRSGYGIFSYPHGIPDSIVAHAGSTLFAVGFWVTTNTPFAKTNVILDDTDVVDFNDVQIGTQFVFLGVISTIGFTKFEIREMEGTLGDQKFIFIDDVTVAGNAGVVNQPPQADAGGDQTVVEGDIVALDGRQSTDVDDGINAYQWSQESGPPIVVLTDASSPAASFTAPQVDQQGAALIFKITVTDHGGLKDSDQVVVNVLDTISGNRPPIVDAGVDQTMPEGERVTLDGSGSYDPDDGIDFFLWQQVAGTSVMLSNPADPMPAFTAPDVSTSGDVLIFELTVQDRGGLIGTDRINVIVTDVPNADIAPNNSGGSGGGCFISSTAY